ncbi:hypothetical protein [Burkholderia anthina]|uniref:hypothetical protein n=1 Tax=Burkholderia anthina TaxID=179879 RepID=UPI0037BF2D59
MSGSVSPVERRPTPASLTSSDDAMIDARQPMDWPMRPVRATRHLVPGSIVARERRGRRAAASLMCISSPEAS